MLPRLRGDLDIMPSPVEGHPGLLLRDSLHYSDAVIVVPPELVPCLACFDGAHSRNDLRDLLYRMSGDLRAGNVGDQLADALARSGFLEDGTFAAMRESRLREFAESPVRLPAHAGSGYPEDSDDLGRTMAHWMGGSGFRQSSASLLGIAAPHVSPEGGYESYRAAYSRLGPDLGDRTFVILGTSHYGTPERFGLTRKPWLTPFGEATPDAALIEELATRAPGAVTMEDYCHSTEHSIEFQIVFLQSIFGPGIRIVPVLCGSFYPAMEPGRLPDDNDDVKRFFGALGEIAAREKDRLFWVLGVDMAHMGQRYGDSFAARAEDGEMLAVAARDRERMERIAAGDARGFWEQVRENRDDLKWCGSSPFYTFLRALPDARGEVHRYEQWNIDEQSVVSFAGMSFR